MMGRSARLRLKLGLAFVPEAVAAEEAYTLQAIAVDGPMEVACDHEFQVETA
jgi:hypothetical protein